VNEKHWKLFGKVSWEDYDIIVGYYYNSDVIAKME